MTGGEVADLLASGEKAQVATINPDGTPHLVTLFYGLVDGKIALFTYRRSQKARNLGRDPRITCLVEAGEDYGELRGAMVYGTAKLIEDHAAVVDVGTRVLERTMRHRADELADYVERVAAKRVAYLVEPVRVVSWDHRKLTRGRARAEFSGGAAAGVTVP